MTSALMQDLCKEFAQDLAPYVNIKSEKQKRQTLAMTELLLDDANDTCEDPLNALIGLLSRAVESYENSQDDISFFEQRVASQQPDIAALRVLIDQHGLGCSDLPEIGSKSMVSRVLSGERSLNKTHIKALAERFIIDPDVFF